MRIVLSLDSGRAANLPVEAERMQPQRLHLPVEHCCDDKLGHGCAAPREKMSGLENDDDDNGGDGDDDDEGCPETEDDDEERGESDDEWRGGSGDGADRVQRPEVVPPSR